MARPLITARRRRALLTMLLTATAFSPATLADAPKSKPAIKIASDAPANGVVNVGQTVTFTLTSPADWPSSQPSDVPHYRLRENDSKTVAEGDLTAGQAEVKVPAKLDKPGWLMLEVSQKSADGKTKSLGGTGVIAAPEQILPALPKPADFDSFWQSQVDKIKAVPANPVLKPVDSGKPDIELFDVTLDNVDGAHVHAQLAKPKAGQKLPVIVQYQYAGVYPLQKQWATDLAARGYLVLNVLAHDLPIYEPKAFYDAQSSGPLKGYTTIGATDKQTSYFRKMFLGDYQAIEYMRGRPDWDGKTLVVKGESQGGMQSFAMAGLHPSVTEMIVVVPAGNDPNAGSVGRATGWPWWQNTPPEKKAAVLNTARYYDPANFAATIKCPAFVAVGLRDTTATPTGVISSFNRISGQKELCVMPGATHTAYHDESSKAVNHWLDAIKATGAAPDTAKTVK